MKKSMILVLTVILALFLGACSSNKVGGDGSTNPRVEYNSKEEIAEKTGLSLPFPEKEASNVKFAVINNEVAEVSYTHNNKNYTLRTSKTLQGYKELGGINDEPVTAENRGFTLYTFKEGFLAEFDKDNVHYTLYSKDATKDELDLETIYSYGAGNSDGSTSTANPIHEVETLAELNEKTGLNLNPNLRGASNMRYAYIDNGVAQIDFTYNDKEYELRASKEFEGYESLGGYYYSASSSYEYNGVAEVSSFEEQGTKVATWSQDGVNYSLSSTDPKVTNEDIENIVALLTTSY